MQGQFAAIGGGVDAIRVEAPSCLLYTSSSLQGLILTASILWIIFGAILLLNTLKHSCLLYTSMDNLAIRAAEDFIHAGYPVEAEAILLCELDGVEADVADDCERVREVLEKAGATEVRLARDEAERVKFWACLLYTSRCV